MKVLLLVLCLSIVHSPVCYGNPVYAGSQAVLGGADRFRDPFTQEYAAEFLTDAKKVILKGKTNMQKWFHDGKEFIKQNGLLC
jgi:cathepsin A (carboxypeptidase C)